MNIQLLLLISDVKHPSNIKPFPRRLYISHHSFPLVSLALLAPSFDFSPTIPPPESIPTQHLFLGDSLSRGGGSYCRIDRRAGRQLRSITRNAIFWNSCGIPPELCARHVAVESVVGQDADALVVRLSTPLPLGACTAILGGVDLLCCATAHALGGGYQYWEEGEVEYWELHGGVMSKMCICYNDFLLMVNFGYGL